MKSIPTDRRFYRRRPAGFTLLEGLLALALFGLLGVGLARSLVVAGEASDDYRTSFHVASVVDGLLDESAWAADCVDTSFTVGPDAEGVSYKTTIEPVVLENMQGEELQEIYRVHILASWDRGLGEETYEAETFRYAPLFAQNP